MQELQPRWASCYQTRLNQQESGTVKGAGTMASKLRQRSKLRGTHDGFWKAERTVVLGIKRDASMVALCLRLEMRQTEIDRVLSGTATSIGLFGREKKENVVRKRARKGGGKAW